MEDIAGSAIAASGGGSGSGGENSAEAEAQGGGSGQAEGSVDSARICMAADCTLPRRPRGRLCAMHQKRRDRKIPFELKDPSVVLKRGRPPAPFSPANRRKKVKHLDEMITRYAGGREAGSLLLREYLESPLAVRRLASLPPPAAAISLTTTAHAATPGSAAAQSSRTATTGNEGTCFETMGRNMLRLLHDLTPASPFFQPLLQALSQQLSSRELAKLLGVTEASIIRSKALSKEENLLFQIRRMPTTAGTAAGEHSNSNPAPTDL